MRPRRPLVAALLTVVCAGLSGCGSVEAPAGGDRDVTQPPTSSGSTTSPGSAEDLAEVRPPSDVEAQVESRIVDLLAEAREAEGLPELTRDPELDQVARRWSQDLLTDGRDLEHNQSFSEQIPGGWTASGENVGWIDDGGMSSADEIAQTLHEGWMDSPGHRENLLSDRYTHVGVGVAHDPEHGYYATQNFAQY